MIRKSKVALISIAAVTTVGRRIANFRPVVQCEPLWNRQRVAVYLSAGCSTERSSAERPVRLRHGSANPLGSSDTPVSRALWC
jgi:hypothetical protein